VNAKLQKLLGYLRTYFLSVKNNPKELFRGIRNANRLVLVGLFVLLFITFISRFFVSETKEQKHADVKISPTASAVVTVTLTPVPTKIIIVPTALPSLTPTPVQTTGTITGVFYDDNKYQSEANKDDALISDSRFAASAVSNEQVGLAHDSPRFTIPDLKPGRYRTSIDYNSSKYFLTMQTCAPDPSRCQSDGNAIFFVDLKAGETIQTIWTFVPK